MPSLETAINGLQQVHVGTSEAQNWRWLVRQKLSAVKDALAEDQGRSLDGWLSARASASDRDRVELMARITELGPRILEWIDPEVARDELTRLLADLDHFRQRLHDLVYDSVSLEIGGSE